MRFQAHARRQLLLLFAESPSDKGVQQADVRASTIPAQLHDCHIRMKHKEQLLPIRTTLEQLPAQNAHDEENAKVVHSADMHDKSL
jgi:hypothetical protein